MTYDDIAWFPLCASLTGLGIAGTVMTYRRRGLLPAARMLGWALIPLGLYLIGAMSLAWKIGTAVSRFVSGFVFSPKVWTGVVVLAVSLMLFVVTGRLRARKLRAASGDAPAPVEKRRGLPALGGRKSAPSSPAASAKPARASRPADDDGFGDIEEILRKRGIS